MTPKPDTATPEGKAWAAAEALHAEGAPVTARAVRERAAVRMAIASQAARDWAKHQALQAGAPPTPETVILRAEGLWQEAYTTAQTAFDTDRAGWQQRLTNAEAEQAELAQEIQRLEIEAERLAAQLDAARNDNDQLRSELERHQAQADQERDQARDALQRAATAEATAATLQAALDKTLAALTVPKPKERR